RRWGALRTNLKRRVALPEGADSSTFVTARNAIHIARGRSFPRGVPRDFFLAGKERAFSSRMRAFRATGDPDESARIPGEGSVSHLRDPGPGGQGGRERGGGRRRRTGARG